MRLVIPAFALLALPGLANPAAAQCRAVSPSYTVALIELYTSQGCSSCPPADAWLSGLRVPGSPPRAIALALHVGYWDYIGWKDPFARREFNERQRSLVARSGGGPYTPQVFVGGAELTQWSQPGRLDAALKSVNGQAPRADIDVQARWIAGPPAGQPSGRPLAVQVRWSADRSARDPQLVLAVKRSGYLTDVAAGENRGSRLRNDDVALTWDGPFQPQGRALTAEITVPGGTGEAALVALALDGSSGAVLQAVELPLASCQAPAGAPAVR